MGVYLSEPETKKNTQTGSYKNISFASSQMQGWRKNMEDAAIHELDIGDGNALFAVFDGHGGPEVSCYVAEIFITILKANPSYSQKNYIKALDETFKKVDEMIDSTEGNSRLRDIRKKLTGSEEGPNIHSIGNGTGCTANVLLITPEKYFIANSGDSRSALCRGGKLIVFSEDHKPESLQQSERIKKAGGFIQMGRVNGGLNLSRSFGDFDYKRNQNCSYAEQMITCKPDIREVLREKEDDFIIMGCDGIWQKYVENSQGMLDILRNQLIVTKDLKKIVQQLLDSLLATDTREGIGCDNMTAILLTLK